MPPLIYRVCLRISPLAALAWNVLIVYMTLGFRHYSHYFSLIQLALNTGDDGRRTRLAGRVDQGKTSLTSMSW